MCSIFYPGEIFLENASCYRVIALHTRQSICVLPNKVLPGNPARAHTRESRNFLFYFLWNQRDYNCNLSDGTNQQKDQHNRCYEEDHVRRRSCDRCRAPERISRRTRGMEKHGLKMNLDQTKVRWVGKQTQE